MRLRACVVLSAVAIVVSLLDAPLTAFMCIKRHVTPPCELTDDDVFFVGTVVGRHGHTFTMRIDDPIWGVEGGTIGVEPGFMESLAFEVGGTYFVQGWQQYGAPDRLTNCGSYIAPIEDSAHLVKMIRDLRDGIERPLLFGEVSYALWGALPKRPVAGARISVQSPTGRYQTTSDRLGRFLFEALQPDVYRLTIDAREPRGFTPYVLRYDGLQPHTGQIDLRRCSADVRLVHHHAGYQINFERPRRPFRRADWWPEDCPFADEVLPARLPGQ